MKAENLVASESQTESIVWPEPKTEWEAEFLALMKAIDDSGIPKLSVEEIEEYLERTPGPAYPRALAMHTTVSASS